MALVAKIPLTWDGEDTIQDWAEGIWLEIVVGLFETPVVRGEDTTIPAAAGTLEGNRINNHLPIELRGSIRAAEDLTDPDDMLESYYDNMETLRTLFASNRPRAPLVAVLPNGSTKTISARPLNIVAQVVVPDEYAEVSVALEGDNDWTTS